MFETFNEITDEIYSHWRGEEEEQIVTLYMWKKWLSEEHKEK